MHRISAALLLGAIAWSLALAHASSLHMRVHDNAAPAQHQCAATIFHSGACDAAGVPQSAPTPAPADPEQIAALDEAVAAALAFSLVRDRGPPPPSELQLFVA